MMLRIQLGVARYGNALWVRRRLGDLSPLTQIEKKWNFIGFGISWKEIIGLSYNLPMAKESSGRSNRVVRRRG
jgi:hypothetical protein